MIMPTTAPSSTTGTPLKLPSSKARTTASIGVSGETVCGEALIATRTGVHSS